MIVVFHDQEYLRYDEGKALRIFSVESFHYSQIDLTNDICPCE